MSENAMESNLYSAPILVVDDEPLTRLLMMRILKENGFSNIQYAESGEDAIERLMVLPPELVLLDIFMPGISGLECCTWIRNHQQLKELPVLILTSITDDALRGQAFQAGASDFVTKPIHPDELIGRVKVHLQNRLNMKSLRHYKQRLEGELENARDLQDAILPSNDDMSAIGTKYHLAIAAHHKSSSELGGDFWGINDLGNSSALWTVDFSGHGVAAALNAFRLQAYLKEPSPLAYEPGAYLQHLNEKLLQLLLRGHFATIFYGVIDPTQDQLRYACACSPHPLILRKNGKIKQLDGCGLPLGIDEQTYTTRTVDFKPGDSLLLYSDALTETPNRRGEYITEEEIAALLMAHKGASPAVLKEKILQYFTRHSRAALRDDLTLCIHQRLEAI